MKNIDSFKNKRVGSMTNIKGGKKTPTGSGYIGGCGPNECSYSYGSDLKKTNRFLLPDTTKYFDLKDC